MKKMGKYIITTVVALLMLGILLPIGINSISTYNGSYYNGTWGSGTPLGYNTTVATLISSVFVIMVVIGIILKFVPTDD